LASISSARSRWAWSRGGAPEVGAGEIGLAQVGEGEVGGGEGGAVELRPAQHRCGASPPWRGLTFCRSWPDEIGVSAEDAALAALARRSPPTGCAARARRGAARWRACAAVGPRTWVAAVRRLHGVRRDDSAGQVGARHVGVRMLASVRMAPRRMAWLSLAPRRSAPSSTAPVRLVAAEIGGGEIGLGQVVRR